MIGEVRDEVQRGLFASLRHRSSDDFLAEREDPLCAFDDVDMKICRGWEGGVGSNPLRLEHGGVAFEVGGGQQHLGDIGQLIHLRRRRGWEPSIRFTVDNGRMDGDDMPRYYFNIRRHGTLEEDPEGSEFPSLEAAHHYAVSAAREIIAEKVLSGDVIDADAFEITGEDGTMLEVVPFRSVLRLD